LAGTRIFEALMQTLIHNAHIRTMDLSRPRAEAILLEHGAIIAIGSLADCENVSRPGYRRINASGRLILPAFQDAHIHLLHGGLGLATSAQLFEAKTVKELQECLAQHAARFPKLQLISGSGWQPGVFGDHNLTGKIIDAVVQDRPAIIYDSSFHNACLNSYAIAVIGLTPNTPDPVNGHFVKAPDGQVTGMLHEDAIAWALKRLPETDDDAWRTGLVAGQAHANAHGITGIIDPRIEDIEARIYGAAASSGALTLRVSGAALVKEHDIPQEAVERLSTMRVENPGPDFWIQSAKFFMDGVFENRTAALLAPYADEIGGNCPTMFTPEQTNDLFVALDAARFQIHTHVIGDAAARVTLDGLEAAIAANVRWPSLHQLAHLQLADPADIDRIAQLGAMANIQPLWARHDRGIPDPAKPMAGAQRLSNIYAFRRMLNAGARWCLSSDWPVSTLNPFEIMETAVTRQARLEDDPIEPFLPQEALTIDECVQGYTTLAAEACWRGTCTGRLLPGFSADLIMLDQNIFDVPSHAISNTNVLLTLFKGKEVYRHPALED
jgi:predicted amidohydrolase YtcJ